MAKVSALLRRRPSGPPDPPDPPRSVLFIELAEMGTTVLACPAVHRLRSSYPDCRVFFLLFKHIDESVKVLNVVPDAQVMTIDVSNAWTIVRDTARVMTQARRQRIGLLAVCAVIAAGLAKLFGAADAGGRSD